MYLKLFKIDLRILSFPPDEYLLLDIATFAFNFENQFPTCEHQSVQIQHIPTCEYALQIIYLGCLLCFAKQIQPSGNSRFYHKILYFGWYSYSERFNVRALIVLFTITRRKLPWQKMELNREHFQANVFFSTAKGDYLNSRATMNLSWL